MCTHLKLGVNEKGEADRISRQPPSVGCDFSALRRASVTPHFSEVLMMWNASHDQISAAVRTSSSSFLFSSSMLRGLPPTVLANPH